MSERNPVAWIGTIPREEAKGELAALYERVVDPANGQLDAIMEVHALHPRGLAAHHDLYRAVMTGTPGLRLADRELIAFTVSLANHCHY